MRPKSPSSLAAWFISLSLASSALTGSLAISRASAQSQDGAARADGSTLERQNGEQPTLLARYATDLTRRARLGHNATNAGRAADALQTVEILSRGAKNNPVLLSETTSDAASVARGVAQRIAEGRVPSNLQGARVLALSRERLLAGTKTSDEFVARLRGVLDEASASHARVVLFLPDFHHFLGTYTAREASDAVRAAIERGGLQVIGATTRAVYDEHIAKDAALAELLQPFELSAGGDAQADRDETAAATGDKLSPELREMADGTKAGGRVGVILQADDLQDAQLASLLRRYGVEMSSRMSRLGAARVEVPAAALRELAASGATRYLSPDRTVRSLGHVTATTGTDLVRTQPAGSIIGGLLTTLSTTLDGTGVGIAIIDSGIDAGHKAFAAKPDLSGCRIKFKKDFTYEATAGDKDFYGHGAHVASAAAGMSTVSGGTYEGVARGADIISLRVLDKNGVGKTSDLLAALNWILSPADPTKPLSSSNPTNATKYNIRVVNLSLGAPAVDSYKNDPVCQAVRKLVDAGIVVAAAAGNNGKDASGNKLYGQIHSPGDEPSAITVGASNTFGTDARNDDGVTTFSSRGPTRGSWTDASGVKHYDNLIKPDLVAPGNKLIYAEADDGGTNPNNLVKQNPQLDAGVTTNDNKKLMYLSGTSMATPLVAGTAALMLQANPKLTPNMVKMILEYTAQPLAGFNTLEQGAGELNVVGAVKLAQLVRTDLGSSPAQGAALLTTSTPPTPTTTIAGYQFPWSQGIVLRQNYATGTNLVMQYQTVYGLGLLMGDGYVLGSTTFTGDGLLMGDGILMGDNIMTSGGTVMGDGTPFMSCAILMGDGILMGDRILMGDGILMGNVTLTGDGILMGDVALQAMSSQVNGDDTSCMKP